MTPDAQQPYNSLLDAALDEIPELIFNGMCLGIIIMTICILKEVMI